MTVISSLLAVVVTSIAIESATMRESSSGKKHNEHDTQ
jgi:hypothetical protein